MLPLGSFGLIVLCVSSYIKVDSQVLESGAEEVHFTVKENNTVQLFCCIYIEQGCFSAFSPYLHLEKTRGVFMFVF